MSLAEACVTFQIWNISKPPAFSNAPARASAMNGDRDPRRDLMIGWAVTFLLVALIAAILGFGGIAGFAVEIAKIIFFVAIILFVISAVVAMIRGRAPPIP
jgi:uncharacterized membrane protein YtjA (UPF0391 family)